MKKKLFHIRLLMSILLTTFFINPSFTYANDTIFINSKLIPIKEAMIDNQPCPNYKIIIKTLEKRTPSPKNVTTLKTILLDGIAKLKKSEDLGEHGKPLFDHLVTLLQQWADLKIPEAEDSLKIVEEALPSTKNLPTSAKLPTSTPNKPETYIHHTFINSKLILMKKAMIDNQPLNYMGIMRTFEVREATPSLENVRTLEKILLDGIAKLKKSEDLGEHGNPLFDHLVTILQQWADLKIPEAEDSLKRVEKAQKKPKIFIHVGLPNTCTTYLQSCFKWLEQNSKFEKICYPSTTPSISFSDTKKYPGNATHIGQTLLSIYNPPLPKQILFKDIDNLLANVSDISKNILFSSDFLCAASPDKALDMSNYLIKKGYDVELIIIIRPLMDLLFFYTQTLKGSKSGYEWIIPLVQLSNNYMNSVMAYNLPVHIVKYDKNNILKNILRIVGEDDSLKEFLSNILVDRDLSRGELNLLLNVNSIITDKNLVQEIYEALIHQYPEKVSAKMTEEETLHCNNILAKIHTSLNACKSEIENSMVEYFLSEPTEVAEGVEDTSIDDLSLQIAVEIIRNYLDTEKSALAVIENKMKDSDNDDINLWLLEILSKKPQTDTL